MGASPRVVTFDCHHDEAGFDRAAFGEAFLDAEGIGAIHVLTRGNDWFQYRDLPHALAAVRNAAEAPPVAYGSSMGGYAALRFGRAAGARAALALSPQYSIDRRKAPFETRWKAEARAIRFRHERAIDAPDRSVVAYDPTLAADRAHVDRIAAEARIERMALPFSGHPCAPFLSDLGLLRLLVHALIADAPIHAVAEEARRRRRQSPTWLGELTHRQPPHRVRSAVALGERAVALAPDSPSVLDRVALKLREAGLFDRAIATHERALAIAPLPNFQWGLTKTLAAAGRHDAALAAAIRLQGMAPDVAGYHRWVAELRLRAGEREAALIDLRRAIDTAPTHRGYRLTYWRERLRMLLDR